MKAIRYQMKKLNRYVGFSKEGVENLFIQSSSYVYKKNIQYTQKSKTSLLFLRKTRVEASKFISNSLKTSDSIHLHFLLKTILQYVTCN